MSNGRSFLSYIIIMRNEEEHMLFLEYFIETLHISPTLKDKNRIGIHTFALGLPALDTSPISQIPHRRHAC